MENQLVLCLPCQVATPISQREPLQMTALPKAAWAEVIVDFAQIGSDYLLVVTDDYSRYPVVDIVSSTSANTVIPKLDKIFSEFGIAEVVRSDNGPPFDSHDFRLFANKLGFAHKKISPLWPRANGEVERFMRTIKKVVKTATVTQRNWKQEMHRFLRNHRATPHCTTGTLPATALFGSNINIKIPQMTNPHRPVDFQSRDSERKEKMKAYADNKNYVRPSALKLGDRVLLKSNPTLKPCPPFEKEPYCITSKNGSMVTATNDNGRTDTRNSSFFRKLDLEDRTPDDLDSSASFNDLEEVTPNEQFIEPVVPDSAPEIVRAAPDAGRTGARERRKPNWMRDFFTE